MMQLWFIEINRFHEFFMAVSDIKICMLKLTDRPEYLQSLLISSLKKMMLSFHEEEEGLPDSFLSKFPSLIKVDIHAKVTDPSVAKSMMGCLLSSLKANGE